MFLTLPFKIKVSGSTNQIISLTLKLIKTSYIEQMIQSIKFTSLFWHSWGKTGSNKDLKTKLELPLLSEHPLRRPSETQKQRRAPQWLNGSSLCDPLHLHKGPSPCLSRKRFNDWEGGGPCCHFHRAKEGLLLAAPKGPGLKGFLRTPKSRLFSSDKRSCEVLTGRSFPYLMEDLESLWWRRFNSEDSILKAICAVYWCWSIPYVFCLIVSYPLSFPPPWTKPHFFYCSIFPNILKQRVVNMRQGGSCPLPVLCDWWPSLTNTATTVTGSPLVSLWHSPETFTASASAGGSA